MASKKELVEFIAGNFCDAGTVTYRRMFGEYGLYCNGIYFAAVCDDQLFVKITDEGRRQYPDLPEAPPYEGAKNYFLVEDVENREFLSRLATVTCQALPAPKPKKKPAKGRG
ncbi:MAG: TfoX/Sxy family protein [Lachnospiraceae bacterium]|jgi:TfoX/Sxy family transcriptional regulator of competence genes|nr:TfoX/Sxy family protein [Lachnospiraceae bacterium]